MDDEDYLPTEDPKPGEHDELDFDITISKREFGGLIKEQKMFEQKEREHRMKRMYNQAGKGSMLR